LLERSGLILTTLGLLGAAAALFASDLHAFAPKVALLATLVGAVCIGVPYARKWQGTATDGVLVVAAMWGVMALPLLPLAILPAASPLPLVVSFIYAFLLAQQSRGQGRYLYTERKVPELEGEARDLALQVVQKAGLRPLAILVAPLPSFNAMVQGLRACVVLLDRRAARELPAQELSALVAHEAGHLKYAHTLFLLGMPSLAVTLAAFLGGGDTQVVLLVGAALVFGLRPALSQAIELRSDEFAESIVGAGPVARMLDRVHADRPTAVNRAIESPWAAAFMSHPIAEVRAARLEGRSPNVSAMFGLAHLMRWGLTAAAVLLALTQPRPRLAASIALVLLIVLIIAASVRVRRAFQKSYRISLASSGGQTLALLRLMLLVGGLVTVLVVYVAARSSFRPETFLLGFMAWLVVALAFKALSSSKGAGLALQPPFLRSSVIEALAAIGEGRSQEGLHAILNVPPKYGRNAWFLAVRGLCQLHVGQSQPARASLEDAVTVLPRFAFARYMLVFRHWLAADGEAAKRSLETLVPLAADDPLVWTLKGMVHQDAGEQPAARAAYEKALALRSADIGALAGLGHVILDEGRPRAEAELAIRNAKEVAPRSPSVLLLEARWLQRSGQAAEAESAFQEALRQLTPGERLLQPKYESLAASWGISGPAAAPSSPSSSGPRDPGGPERPPAAGTSG
jgi:Zn-dependent protease with chaperone function/Tfp pilus assembly protein PilF